MAAWRLAGLSTLASSRPPQPQVDHPLPACPTLRRLLLRLHSRARVGQQPVATAQHGACNLGESPRAHDGAWRSEFIPTRCGLARVTVTYRQRNILPNPTSCQWSPWTSNCCSNSNSNTPCRPVSPCLARALALPSLARAAVRCSRPYSSFPQSHLLQCPPDPRSHPYVCPLCRAPAAGLTRKAKSAGAFPGYIL